MKLFLQIPDGLWENINQLTAHAKNNPHDTIPARKFIEIAIANQVREQYQKRVQSNIYIATLKI